MDLWSINAKLFTGYPTCNYRFLRAKIRKEDQKTGNRNKVCSQQFYEEMREE